MDPAQESSIGLESIRPLVVDAPTPSLWVDAEGIVRLANRAAGELFDRPATDIEGTAIARLLPHEVGLSDPERRARVLAGAAGRRLGADLPVPAVTACGRELLVDVALTSIDLREGPMIVVQLVDATERIARERALQRMVERQAAVAELGELALRGAEPDALIDQSLDRIRDLLDVPLVKLLELRRDRGDLLLRAGCGWRDGLVGHATVSLEGTAAGAVARGGGTVSVDDLLAEDRYQFATLLTEHGVRGTLLVPVHLGPGVFGVLGAHTREPRAFDEADRGFLRSIANVLADAIGRWTTEQDVRHQARHDPLTGLGNRVLLAERFAEWEAAGRRQALAMLYLDLDGFKAVNDLVGHSEGDRLLRLVGHRLSRLAASADVLCRIGGDEFVAVMPADREPGPERHAGDIRHGLCDDPFVVDDRVYRLGASIGIATSQSSCASSLDDLLARSDAALAEAKASGRGCVRVYDEGMHRRTRERRGLEEELTGALARDELWVGYQPVVRLADRRVVGFEALVRWDHPVRGTVLPGAFIPAAEQSDLILGIGEHVLARVGVDAPRMATIRPDIRVSINLSPRQLAGANIVAALRDLVHRPGMAPQLLAIEVTETLLLSETESTHRVLDEVRRMGVKVLLDDFGTGFSSLTHLQRYAIDGVKIDRSFVATLEASDTDRSIVSGVATIASGMGLEIIGEGVESDAQAAMLLAYRVPHAQGFAFAPALALDDALDLLARGRP